MELIKRLWRDESGLSGLEYAILAGVLVAFVAMGATLLGPEVRRLYESAIAGTMSAANAAP